MSSFFRAIASLADILWAFTPEGLKAVWMSVPSGMRTVIITLVAIALVAAGFRLDRLWPRIAMYVFAALMFIYLIAQSLNYLSR